MRNTTSVILFAFTITGCALDDNPVETSTKEARLAAWGVSSCDQWDPFEDEWGIESEEAYAFMDICGDPFGGGGGGGGGGGFDDPGICSIYNGPVTGRATGTGRSTVVASEGEGAYQAAFERAAREGRRNAGNQATSRAGQNCRASLYPAGFGACRGRANSGFGGTSDLGCYWQGAEYPEGSNTVVIAECSAEASVDCEFEWTLY